MLVLKFLSLTRQGEQDIAVTGLELGRDIGEKRNGSRSHPGTEHGCSYGEISQSKYKTRRPKS